VLKTQKEKPKIDWAKKLIAWLNKLAEWHCDVFHDDYSLPINGKVFCRTCGPWRFIRVRQLDGKKKLLANS
jgi:hypothetical protein